MNFVPFDRESAIEVTHARQLIDEWQYQPIDGRKGSPNNKEEVGT